MANIRKNEQIRHIGDLQNAITSAILRQTGEFTREDIYAKVEQDIKFSAFEKSPDVKRRVDDTIQTLWVNNCIKSVSKGKYVLSMSFPAVTKR